MKNPNSINTRCLTKPILWQKSGPLLNVVRKGKSKVNNTTVRKGLLWIPCSIARYAQSFSSKVYGGRARAKRQSNNQCANQLPATRFVGGNHESRFCCASLLALLWSQIRCKSLPRGDSVDLNATGRSRSVAHSVRDSIHVILDV
jgi:hypothetical protein